MVDDNTVQLDHLRAGRWTKDTLPVDGWTGLGSALLTGTRRDDVWLAAGTSLRRYDGRRWTTVALPDLETDLGPVWLDTVESPRRGILYAALTIAPFRWSEVFRYANGHWTNLGAPFSDDRYETVLQMKVVDGALLTRSYDPLTDFGQDYSNVYSRVNGEWTWLYNTWIGGTDYTGVKGGWYPRSYSNHLLLGTGFYGAVPECEHWIGAQPLVDCTTTRATTASAQLKNGTIVLAESDYYRYPDPSDLAEREYVEGGFGLRDIDGRETPLAGEPGFTAQFVVAEAHRNAAWAVTGTYTDTGWKDYLQRYDG